MHNAYKVLYWEDGNFTIVVMRKRFHKTSVGFSIFLKCSVLRALCAYDIVSCLRVCLIIHHQSALLYSAFWQTPRYIIESKNSRERMQIHSFRKMKIWLKNVFSFHQHVCSNKILNYLYEIMCCKKDLPTYIYFFIIIIILMFYLGCFTSYYICIMYILYRNTVFWIRVLCTMKK